MSAPAATAYAQTRIDSQLLQYTLPLASAHPAAAAMAFYTVSAQARQSQASPSVSLEKGAYRMRAPLHRRSALSGLSFDSAADPSSAKLRRARRGSQALSRDGLPQLVRYEKQVAMLVMVLVCATVTCFGVAYYLFTTRCVAAGCRVL